MPYDEQTKAPQHDLKTNGTVPSKTKKKTRRWVVILIVLLVLVGAGAGFLYYFSSTVTLSDLTSLSESDAIDRITDAGLVTGEVERLASDDVATGHVISQTPQANSRVKKGSEVQLAVSSGPQSEQISVPDLTGMTVDEAQSALSPLGFYVRTGGTQESTTVAANQICAQSPAANSQAAKGSAITVMLSLGTSSITIPDVTGQSKGDAKTALENLGLTVNITEEYNSSTPSGCVISSNPSAQTTVATGSTVTLRISKGSEASSAVSVPQLQGKTKDEATAALEDVGLTINVTYNNLDEGDMKVASQNPEAGTKVDSGSSITVVIAGMPL